MLRIHDAVRLRRALRSSLALAPLLSLTASCRGEAAPPVDAGGRESEADRHLVWHVPGPFVYSEPAVGEDRVFYLAADHSVTAISKTGGKVLWTIHLPIDRGLLTGLSSLSLPGQLLVADQDVFSLDPSTGAIQWQFHATVGRRPGYQAPALAGDLLLTGSGSGHVFALDRKTGAPRWQRAVADTSDGVWRPVVADGVAYVGVSRFPGNFSQTGSRVVALDARTGTIRWTRDLPLTAARPVTGVRDVAVVGSLVIATSGDGVVHALDTSTGLTRWTAPRAVPPKGSIFKDSLELDSRGVATDGVRIYVTSSTGVIQALSPRDGSQLWVSPSDLGSANAARTDGANVYVVYDFGPVAELDAATGAVRWKYTTLEPFRAAPGENFWGTAATDAGNVYLGGKQGYYAFRKN